MRGILKQQDHDVHAHIASDGHAWVFVVVQAMRHIVIAIP
jgi:hypothetical protein